MGGEQAKNYPEDFLDLPDANGFFGQYGGAILPPPLVGPFKRIDETYEEIRTTKKYLDELNYIRKHFQGRPTPVYYCRNLSAQLGGADIYLKREDLNHMGAHKLNHTMAEGLLAKHMGMKKLIAETGAGQHGVAVATAAAYFGLECEIHMGEIDIEKEHPNVVRMYLLGATVVPVTFGGRSLKEAVDSAFGAYMEDPETMFFAIGSVVGPHPFPKMIRDYQRIVGEEAREQFMEMTGGKLPDYAMACVGGGSNAMGLFQGFLNDESVEIHGVEARGKSDKIGDHSATLAYGVEGEIHGFRTIVLLDDEGNPAPVHTIASGLDYPGVGPEHAFLRDLGRVKYSAVSDDECLKAFYALSRLEGIIPALESAHAVAHAMHLAPDLKGKTILVNLSGRGDKDIDFVVDNYGHGG